MDHLTHSPFQSIFQLSVAINLTFAVLLTLFSSTLQRQKDIITSLISGLELRSGRLVRQADRSIIDDLKTSALDLQIDIDIKSMQISERFSRYFQPAFLGMSLISLVFLFITTFRSGDEVGNITILVSLICMLPFIIFAIYCLASSYEMSRKVRQLRAVVDDRVPEV